MTLVSFNEDSVEKFEFKDLSCCILGYFDLLGLCLRRTPKCDIVDSTAPVALVFATEELGFGPTWQQPLPTLFRSFYVRDSTRGDKFRPY